MDVTVYLLFEEYLASSLGGYWTSSLIFLPPILNHNVFCDFIQVNVIIYLDACPQGQMADLFFSKSKLSVAVPFIVFNLQKYTV